MKQNKIAAIILIYAENRTLSYQIEIDTEFAMHSNSVRRKTRQSSEAQIKPFMLASEWIKLSRYQIPDIQMTRMKDIFISSKLTHG